VTFACPQIKKSSSALQKPQQTNKQTNKQTNNTNSLENDESECDKLGSTTPHTMCYIMGGPFKSK
jgi:hypothetical protein